MRMFRRHFSDSNPRLVSLSPLCEPINVIDESDTSLNSGAKTILKQPSTTPPSRYLNENITSSKSTYASGLSTWSKKVGKKWDQLKRSDSSELLSLSTGHRTGQWSPNTPITSNSEPSIIPLTGGTALRIRKRISRVESLRNLFTRSDNKTPSTSNRSSFSDNNDEDELNRLNKHSNSPFLNGSNNNRKFNLNQNINLSKQQLLDYLLLFQPSERKRIAREMLQSMETNQLKENDYSSNRNSRSTLSPLRNSCKKNFRSVKNFFKRSSSEGSIATNKQLNSQFSNNEISESMDELCSFLNNILIGTGNNFENETSRSIESLQKAFSNDDIIRRPQINVSMMLKSKFAHRNVCIGPDDDTDSADDDMFPNEIVFKNQKSAKRLRSSTESLDSIHKRQIINCSYNKTNESSLPSYIDKEMKSVRISASDFQHITIDTQNSNPYGSPCMVFYISNILPDCEAERYGKINVGDTIIKINDKQLRGLKLDDVHKLIENHSTDIFEMVLLCTPLHVSTRSQSQPGPSTSSAQIVDNSIKSSQQPVATGMKKFITPNRHSTFKRPWTPSNRPKSMTAPLVNVTFKKGPGLKSLGFSIVGGSDSPRGNIGIYVKTVFAHGQASEEGTLRAGDQIYSVNGTLLQDLTHAEALNVFKNIKYGDVDLQILRREKSRR